MGHHGLDELKRTFLPILLTCILALVGCAKGSDEEVSNQALPDDPTTEVDEGPPEPDVIRKGEDVQARGWTLPTYTPEEENEVLALYKHLDPENKVPKNLLKKTILYFHKNNALIDVKDYITVVDFTPHSRKERFFVINMKLGSVVDLHVAHGKGSDSGNSGYATKFSNTRNSEMSSLGFYLISEDYKGKHGMSLRLDGLSPSNSKARERAVVIHGANYVHDSDIKPGRSWGCPALSWKGRDYVLSRLKDGSLMYIGRSRFE